MHAICICRARVRAVPARGEGDALEVARLGRRPACEAGAAVVVAGARTTADASGARAGADVDAAGFVAGGLAGAELGRARRADVGAIARPLARARDANEARRAGGGVAAGAADARVERADAVDVVLLQGAPAEAGAGDVHRRPRVGGVPEAERVSDLVDEDAAEVLGAGRAAVREAERCAVDVDVRVAELSGAVGVEDRLRERAGLELVGPGCVVEEDAAVAVVAGDERTRSAEVGAERGAGGPAPRPRRDVELTGGFAAEVAARRKREEERER